MSTPGQERLKKHLEMAEKRLGSDSPYVKSLREQLAAMESSKGKTAAQTYFSGRPMESRSKK